MLEPKKLSENPPWVALSFDRDHIPSFPRKRESSGRGLNTRAGTQSFQTASKVGCRILWRNNWDDFRLLISLFATLTL